jgi:hypothetical protein
LVGPPGFEPGTSCTPSKRASQAAPRPEELMTYEHDKQLTSLASHVERFTKERPFLKGVSPATLEWYESSFKAFAPVLERPYQSSAETKIAVVERIMRLQTESIKLVPPMSEGVPAMSPTHFLHPLWWPAATFPVSSTQAFSTTCSRSVRRSAGIFQCSGRKPFDEGVAQALR